MEMIAHQAIRMHLPSCLAASFAQRGQESAYRCCAERMIECEAVAAV
jgi:hypothetical protein